MPLRAGKGNAVRSENIREMIESGHPRDQSVAAAYRKSREGKKSRRRARKSA